MILWEYSDIAIRVINGNGFSYYFLGSLHHTFTSPLFVWCCALIYKFTNFNHYAVFIFQFFLFLGLISIVYHISDRIFGRKVALLSGLLVGFHPALMFYVTHYIHTLILDAFLFALLAWVWGKKKVVPMGIVLGLSILSRATILCFLPLGLWWARDMGKRLIGVLVIAVLVVSPWCIRNTFVVGKPTLINAIPYFYLWVGNNPDATGNLLVKRPTEILGMSETEQNVYFKHRVFAYLKAKPAHALKMFAKKFYYFFWFSPNAGRNYSRHWLVVYRVYYSLLLFFFLYGLLKALCNKRLWAKSSVIFFIILGIALAHSFCYVEGRHRWGVEALMIIFSSFGIMSLLTRRNNANIIRRKYHPDNTQG